MRPGRQPRHADKARTRDDYRTELAMRLTWARSLDDITVDTLKAQYPKLPVDELARCLADAKERRAYG